MSTTTAPIQRAPTLETFRGDDARWYFHLLAGNGLIMFRSDQSYTTADQADDAAGRLAIFGDVDEVFTATDGQFHFRLSTAGTTPGPIVSATSEGYTRRHTARQSAARAIELLNAPSLRSVVRDPA